MDVKTLLKWGLIALVGFLAVRWFSGLFNQSAPDIQGGSIYGGWPYAAPLTYAYPVRGWAPRGRAWSSGGGHRVHRGR